MVDDTFFGAEDGEDKALSRLASAYMIFLAAREQLGNNYHRKEEESIEFNPHTSKI